MDRPTCRSRAVCSEIHHQPEAMVGFFFMVLTNASTGRVTRFPSLKWFVPAIAEPLHNSCQRWRNLHLIPWDAEMLQHAPRYWMNTEKHIKKYMFSLTSAGFTARSSASFCVGSSGCRGQGPSLIPNFTQAEFQSTVGSPQPWLVQPAVVGPCKSIYLYIYIYLSISIYISIYLSLSISISIFISISLSIYIYTYVLRSSMYRFLNER